VAGEHEIERPWPQPIDGSRKVTQQDAKIGFAVDKVLRPGPAAQVRARIDADQLHTAPAQLERHGLVGQQRGLSAQLEALRSPRERVARHAEIVIAENGVARWEPGEQTVQAFLAARVGEQVARDAHEVRPALGRPRDAALHGTRATRRHTQVKVRQMHDP
jgi:hypothetical protein